MAAEQAFSLQARPMSLVWHGPGDDDHSAANPHFKTEIIVSKLLLATAAALVLTGSAAMASSSTPSIDHREARQTGRIVNGVATGRLGPLETARVALGQAKVHAMERRAKSDGVVTWNERLRIQHAQNVESRRIWRLKHN